MNYLIIGGTSNIGSVIAKSLSNSENVVYIASRNESRLNEVINDFSGKGIAIPCDVTKPIELQTLFEKIKSDSVKLDGLVYSAGIFSREPIQVFQYEDLEKMFQVNLFGFYEACRQFRSSRISNSGSSIVGISSYSAITNESGVSAYAMTKAAMNTQVNVLAKEFAKRRIRVNTVMPALVQSYMGRGHNNWSESELQEINSKQSFGVIPIDQVANLVLFLLSDKAAYITGENIAISAGYHG